MTEKERYTLHQNGNYHTVIDEEENVPLIMIEFKENEFPVYACFHRIIDLLNEQEEEIQRLKIQLQTDDVCNKCKHEYLVQQNDGYYISKCKKGFDECSKGTIKYCEDFELGDDVDD